MFFTLLNIVQGKCKQCSFIYNHHYYYWCGGPLSLVLEQKLIYKSVKSRARLQCQFRIHDNFSLVSLICLMMALNVSQNMWQCSYRQYALQHSCDWQSLYL